MEKDKAPKPVAVGKIVLNAIRKLQGDKGVGLPALKKFLRDAKNIDTGVHDAEIKLGLKKAIDRGFLVREGGNYKVKAARRRRRRSGGSRRKRRTTSPKRRRRRRTSSGSRRRRRTTGSRRRRRRSSGKRRSSTRRRRRRRRTAAAADDE